MVALTDNQLIHRQYLRSPVWLAKRAEALAHYGPVCSRCTKHGTDVHHKTYVRVGGWELMDDLEVMCRGCHDAHHRAERAAKQRKGNPHALNRQGLYRMLTKTQRELLCQRFVLTDAILYSRLTHGNWKEICLAACKMLGASRFYEGARLSDYDRSQRAKLKKRGRFHR